MAKLQTQGVHHITLVGADRQTSREIGGFRDHLAINPCSRQCRRHQKTPVDDRKWPAAAKLHLKFAGRHSK